MEPVTPSKRKGGAPVEGADEPTAVVRPVGEDTGMVRGEYELSPGTQLGEYRIEGPLGGGGMGEVFTAIHPKIGKRAAIKVLKKELSNPFNVERFIDEAKVVNTIGHPNIVDIFAFGEMPDGRCYFVMELLVGETLRERIARGRMEADEVAAILKPLTRALDAAHTKGVIHRDLKPDNVFLVAVPDEKPIVKLLDFGIAKLAKADHRVEQTKSGVMVGTPQYIAPEQAKGHTIDERADIYALGGIAFEMLTGRPPFVADNAMEMVAKHLMEPPVKPSSIVPTVPPELDALVLAMLAKDPARRPALADIALIIDRLKISIRLEDAETISYQGAGDDDATPMIRDTPPPRMATPVPRHLSAQPVAPVPPVFTPGPAPVEAFAGYSEPVSGAHTSVEPVVDVPIIGPADHTERDAVEIKRSRGLYIVVSLVVLGIATILSFALIKALKGGDGTPDAAVVAVADTAPSPDTVAVGPDAGVSIEPIQPADAAVVVDAAAAVDAATVLPPPADAAVARPDAGVIQPRQRSTRLVLDIQNAGKTTTILANGRRVGSGRHFERELVLNQPMTFEVHSEGRKPHRFTVRPTTTRPINMTIKLELDVMEPR